MLIVSYWRRPFPRLVRKTIAAYRSCEKCAKQHRYVLHFDIYKCDGDLRTARRARLISRDFATAYGPVWIWANVGCDFMRSANRARIRINTILSRRYLWSSHASFTTKCMLDEYLILPTLSRDGVGIQQFFESVYLVDVYEFIHEHRSVFEHDNTLVFTFWRMNEMLAVWRRTKKKNHPLDHNNSGVHMFSFSLYSNEYQPSFKYLSMCIDETLTPVDFVNECNGLLISIDYPARSPVVVLPRSPGVVRGKD